MFRLGKSANCPNCESASIRRSRRNGPVEYVLHTLLFISPYRCRDCDTRYFRFRFSRASGGTAVPAAK